MIKASIMFSTHVIHVLLRNTLIFFIVIFIALFFWLKSGIEADSIIFGKYKVEKLYLKLGKKLTLKADRLFIPKNKAKPSFDNLDKTFDNIKYLFTFFDTIDLKKITFEDNHFHFSFTDNILYIASDDYEIAGNIHRIGQTLKAKVSMLYLKKHDVKIKGDLTYNLKRHILKTTGTFDAYNIKGTFEADKKHDDIYFKLKSKVFTDLKTVMNTFRLNNTIKSWIVDKVQAKKYKLNFLEGHLVLDNKSLKMDFDTLKGEAFIKDAKVYYNHKLAPVKAKSFTIKFKNKSLYFDLKTPTYLHRVLNGSTVAIVGLGDKNVTLKLNLFAKTFMDKEIHKILDAYSIKIPIRHKGKEAKAHVKLDIPLGKKRKKINIFVKVDVNQSDIWYKNIKIPFKKAKIIFDNTKKEKITVYGELKKGKISVGKRRFTVFSGKVHYVNRKVTLKNVHLKDTWFEGKVTGTIDLSIKKAKVQTKVKYVYIGGKEKFLIIKNKLLAMQFDFKNNLQVNIPILGLSIRNTPQSMKIKISSIKKLKPYLQNIGLNVNDGTLDILKKGSNYSYTGVLRRNDCFFYGKNNICKTKVPIEGKVSKGKFTLNAFNKRLRYTTKNSRLKVKNLNIDLKKFLDSYKKTITKRKKQRGGKLVILGTKSKVRYGKYTLVTDSYDIEVSPNGNINATGSLDGDIVKFSKKGKILSLRALRVKDKMLHPLIGFNGLKNGRYSLKKVGDFDKIVKGQIIVEGGILSDFKAYNNTLAFINAIPALATFSNPGFSEKGFKIKEGLVEYRMIGNRVIFDSIFIKGSSASIVGKGELNLKTKKINMNLAIQTARELGKIVGNLPLVGYILMGKDKSITIGLTITGTFNKPIVKTSAAIDIFSLPLQLIKRTLESPAHILNK